MANTNLPSGFIQPILKVGVALSTGNKNSYNRDYQYRAYSNHLPSDQHFDLLTHQAATFWLWVMDEIHRGRANRNTAREQHNG
jgi:hypothetical protein